MKKISYILSKLLKEEAGKSQIKIGDFRQMIKLMRGLNQVDKIKIIQYLLSNE